jgi:hypothetical protein
MRCGQPREAAHVLTHRLIALLDIGRTDVRFVGRSIDWQLLDAGADARAVFARRSSVWRFRIVLHKLREVPAIAEVSGDHSLVGTESVSRDLEIIFHIVSDARR